MVPTTMSGELPAQKSMPGRHGASAGRWRRWGALLASAALVPALLLSAPAAATATGVGGAAGRAAAGAAAPSIQVISSPRADKVSDGNVLLAVNTAGAALERVQLNGTDVTDRFADLDGRPTALLDGLSTGSNTVTARVAGADVTATVVNYPRTGPMFSGKQEQPFICQTAAFRTLGGRSLGPATDAACSAPTVVEWLYRSSTDRSLKPLPANGSTPADLASTTTTQGRTVPYVVRVESGVINRSIYEFAVLADPKQPAVSPFQRPTGWNGRLAYNFGGGCPGGWYKQGAGTGGINDDWLLGQGYAFASSSLNVFGNNCQPVTAAETMAMTKEHVIETIGAPEATLGIGCSGGSYQVFNIGDNYPGLLDGILAGCVFPEVDFATINTITDARLLQVYFGKNTGYTDEQKRAVSGFGKVGTINNLGEAGRRIDPRVYCPGELPANLRYDPVTNPGGARCDVYSHQLNIFGAVPATDGRIPLRPLDNVGIQYGLAAVNSKAITVDQFLDLNAKIGGFDRDANVVAQRTVADRSAIDTSYSTGQLVRGGRLGSLPIIELREYTDELPNGDIHLKFHSFSFRDRLTKANGDAANHVMWTLPFGKGGFGTGNPVFRDAVNQLDAWTSTVQSQRPTAGTTTLPSHSTVVAAKPAGTADACWSPTGSKVNETQVPGVRNTQCNTWYPGWPSPRMVAGAPVVNDVIACHRKPVSQADYQVSFTPAQLSRLRSIFPSGVCNWSVRGIGQTLRQSTSWPSFGTGMPRS